LDLHYIEDGFKRRNFEDGPYTIKYRKNAREKDLRFAKINLNKYTWPHSYYIICEMRLRFSLIKLAKLAKTD